MMNIGVARLAASSRARMRGRLLAAGLTWVTITLAAAGTTGVRPAVRRRSCHDDPIIPGDALPGYELGAELGRGVWGVVVAAVDRQGRRVAVKELDQPLVGDPEVRRR